MYITDKNAKRFLYESFKLNATFYTPCSLFYSTLLAKVIVFQYTKCQSAILFSSQRQKKIDYETATVKLKNKKNIEELESQSESHVMAFLWLLDRNDFRWFLWCEFICDFLFSIFSRLRFDLYPFLLLRSPLYFRTRFSLIHMDLPHYAFPMHLIKIRQNEKCDMSIYFLVSNIGYCSVAVCVCDALRSVPCYKSYVMLGCKKNRQSVRSMFNVQCSYAVWVCVCYAKHMPYILVFYLISIPQWIGWYIRSIYEIKTSTLFQRLFVCVCGCECGFVVTKHIAVILAFPRSGIFRLFPFGFCCCCCCCCWSCFMFWSQALMGLIFIQLFTVPNVVVHFVSNRIDFLFILFFCIFLHFLTCFTIEIMICEKYISELSNCIRWTKHFRIHISLLSIFRISQNAYTSREMNPANSLHVGGSNTKDLIRRNSYIEAIAWLHTSVSFEIDNKSQVEGWNSNHFN